jgi:hypothetical protein
MHRHTGCTHIEDGCNEHLTLKYYSSLDTCKLKIAKSTLPPTCPTKPDQGGGSFDYTIHFASNTLSDGI